MPELHDVSDCVFLQEEIEATRAADGFYHCRYFHCPLYRQPIPEEFAFRTTVRTGQDHTDHPVKRKRSGFRMEFDQFTDHYEKNKKIAACNHDNPA
jgi:hypothetical protein